MVLSECVCPGRELRLQCSIEGGVATLWKGTAFDCLGQGNEILLRHSQFESGGATGTCNNGMIIGRNLNRTFDGPNHSIFTSQLIIHLPLLNTTNNRLVGRTVECARSSDSINIIGNHTITYTRHSSGRSMCFTMIQMMIPDFNVQLHLLITFTSPKSLRMH